MGELSEPKQLNREQCLRYKERLATFYYSNIKACSYMDSFTYKDAEQKIDGLIEYVSGENMMAHGLEHLWRMSKQAREFYHYAPAEAWWHIPSMFPWWVEKVKRMMGRKTKDEKRGKRDEGA